MKRLTFCLALLAMLIAGTVGAYRIIEVPEAVARTTVVMVGGGAAAGDFCSSQSWATLTSFKLDFSHTTDAKTACLSTGTEVGTLSANTTIATPSPVAPGSGGAALLANGDNEYITFDNTLPYFRSTEGEIRIKFKPAAAVTSSITIMRIIAVVAQDRMNLEQATTGKFVLLWEDNNTTTITDNGAFNNFDIDDVVGYNHWLQARIYWDTAAGSDEVCTQIRYDSNDDGAWDGPGAGPDYWSTADCSGATDVSPWSSEPDSADSFDFGLVGTHSQDIYIDDVEISYTAP